jgi:hypothetical protein
MAEKLRASTNQYATDLDPAATRRAVLALLVELPAHDSLDPRIIGQRLYGSDLVGRSSSASAIGWLHNARLIERGGAYGGAKRFRATTAGRNAHALAVHLDGDSRARRDELADLPPCAMEA